MKKRNGVLIFLFCITLFLSSFIYGYKIMGNRINRKPLIAGKDQEEENLNRRSRVRNIKGKKRGFHLIHLLRKEFIIIPVDIILQN